MRKADHQLQQTLFIPSWQKADKRAERRQGRETGTDCRLIKTYEPYVSEHADVVQDEAPG